MDNVPDPTDFPPESDAPGLRKLDSAFSCQICGEVYDAPMMLSCGHSFCSMCVRKSLRDRHECPSCRSPAEEVQLVKNTQLEDLCDSWRSARPTVLKLVEKVESLVKSLESTNNEVDARPRKKRRVINSSAAKSSSERDSVEIIGTSEDERPTVDIIPSSDAEENETEMQMDLVVNCPVCSQPVVNRNVSDHIDSGCKSLLAKPKSEQTSTRNAWNNILGNGLSKPESRAKGRKQQKSTHNESNRNAERIPKPPYNVLKDKKIREMLAEHQLPTTGSREQLIARHTQFVLLYNANLDRAEHLRKSVSDLRQELKRWEDSVDVKKVSVEDAQAYVKKRHDEFKKHVEAAKASLRNKTRNSSIRSATDAAPVSSVSSVNLDDVTKSEEASNPPGDSRSSSSPVGVIIPDSEGEDAP